MDPPPDATLEDGFWRYEPDLPPLPEARFADAGRGAGDWRLCAMGECRALNELLPASGADIVFRRCVDGVDATAW